MNDDIITIITRLEYLEETIAGEIETWIDPETKKLYNVPITVERHFHQVTPVDQ